MQADITHGQVTEETVSADFVTRLLAGLIDGAVFIIPSIILSRLLPLPIYLLIAIAIGAGYQIYFWSSTGQTVGKRVMGLKVVSSETGQILDVQGAAIRYACTFVSAIPFGLGFLAALWDPKHDTWHDKLAKTKVISIK